MNGPRAGRRHRAATQRAHVRLEHISGGVVRLPGGLFRAVLEIGGADVDLLSPGEQEALVASYAAVLNGLAFPVQLLVRVTPADLDGYLRGLERRSREALPEGLASLALDHVAFVRRLAERRALLERRYYVVIPDDDAAAGPCEGGGATPLGMLRRLVGGGGGEVGRAARGAQPDGGSGVPAVVRRRLGARCDELGRQLGRCGLVARRLDDIDLARLFYAAWCPELSRAQRIRQSLADYTALVVRSPLTPQAALAALAAPAVPEETSR